MDAQSSATQRPSGFVPHASLATRRCQNVIGKSWDEQLQELVSQPDPETRQLRARLPQSENEKDKLRSENEKEKLRSENSKEKLKLADYQLFVAKTRLVGSPWRNDSKMHAGEVCRQNPTRRERPGRHQVHLGRYGHSGATASFLQQAIQTCTPSTADASTFLKDLYAKLSGQLHHPPWCGPGTKVSGTLIDTEKCADTDGPRRGFRYR